MTAQDSAVTVIGVGAIGIFVAYIFYHLYTERIWVDEYVTELTSITEIMAVIVMVFILVGVLLAAMRR